MRKTANLCVRIEPEIKKQAESILADLGIQPSQAINMFYKQIILNEGLPFDAKIPEKYVRIPEEELKMILVGDRTASIPNKETLEALSEYQEMKKDKTKYKRYKSFKELLEEL